jgi:hypothetical protein
MSSESAGVGKKRAPPFHFSVGTCTPGWSRIRTHRPTAVKECLQVLGARRQVSAAAEFYNAATRSVVSWLALTRILWYLAAAIIAAVILAILSGFAHDLEARNRGLSLSSYDSERSVIHHD